jgi:hypothetical protein
MKQKTFFETPTTKLWYIPQTNVSLNIEYLLLDSIHNNKETSLLNTAYARIMAQSKILKPKSSQNFVATKHEILKISLKTH